MKKLLAKKKNNKGFSLVELIVVVLIIAIIAVALAPQVMKWVGKSKESVDDNNAASIKSAVLAGVADYQTTAGTMTPITTPKAVTSFPTYPVGSPTTLEDYIANSMGKDRPKTQKNADFFVSVTTSGAVTVDYVDVNGVSKSK